MPEEATETDEPRKLDLSTVQVAASALAAVSAAVFASWFGTAGTLIGAALGSVVATVASATYSYSLKRTAEIARRKAQQVRETGSGLRGSLPRPRGSEPGADDADRTRTLPAQTDDQTDDQTDAAAVPWWKRLDPRGTQLPWAKLGLASAAVMVVAMVVLTSFEGLTGRSLSSFFGNDESSSTTVGNVFSGNRAEPTEEPTPTEQTPTEAPSESPSQEPTSEPSEAPSESPTPTPTETEAPVPTPTPTLPTTPTPTEDPGAAGTPGATPSS